jgi:uncharacterized membrane protein (UPF0136 family)
MNFASIVVLIFGAFSLAGGFIGYFKVGSMVSLLAGGISGLILLASSFGINKGNQIAAITSLVVAILLGGRFLMTLVKEFKVMPDLIMVLLSAASILFVVLQMIKK